MSDNAVGSVFVVCVFALIVLFAGDPDLMDAIIGFIKARS